MNHTPGPWRISSKSKYLVKTDEYRICQVFRSTIDPSLNEQAEADARLIAAAPDLLEALKEVLKGMEAAYTEGCSEVPPNIDWFDYSSVTQAYTAIAKATGGNHAQKS